MGWWENVGRRETPKEARERQEAAVSRAEAGVARELQRAPDAALASTRLHFEDRGYDRGVQLVNEEEARRQHARAEACAAGRHHPPYGRCLWCWARSA